MTAVTAIPKNLFEEVPAAPGSVAYARRLVALTRDESLVAALQEVATMGVDIAVVHDEFELTNEMLGAPSSVALIDAAYATSSLEQLVDALARQFPDARLLVAGNGLEQSQLATRIASQRVYRFVHKPASAQRLKLFFDAANRPSDAARLSSTQTIEVLKVPADPAASGGGSRPARGPLLGAGIAVAVLLAALLAWALRPAPAPVAKPAPISRAASIEQLIQRADQAFARSNFVARDGSSAGELYQQALAVAPEDERARSGFSRSVDYGLRGVEEALTLGQLDLAADRIDAVRKVSPRNSRLDFLASQLTHERERVSGDPARKAAPDGRSAQLKGQLEASADALRRGALLDPVDDSALFHLRAAERLAPADPQVLALRTTLASRLLAAADASLMGGQIMVARRQLDAAGILGADPATLERLRRQADQLVSDTAAKASAPAPAAAPQTAAPAPAAAVAAPAEVVQPVAQPAAPSAEAPAKASTPEVVSAANLKHLHTVDPEFPTRALVQGLSGWVDLEFTVKKDGSVRDVVVRAAEPRGVFDAPAIEAMRHWRFGPVVKDGQDVEQRAWLRMRFTLKDR